MLVLAATVCLLSASTIRWVSVGSDGKLVYGRSDRGDRIVDFSYAGYMGGGVKAPDVPEVRRIQPSGGDDAGAIQSAIEDLENEAVYGALVLGKGVFHCSRPIRIGSSGIVLRGSGSGDGGTNIQLTGSPHVGIYIIGSTERVTSLGHATALSSAYIPCGVSSIEVADASGFRKGDIVQISKPVTQAWLQFMGMDRLERDGKPERWLSGSLRTERSVTAVAGHRLSLDVPLTDCYDATYEGDASCKVVRVGREGEIRQDGIEDLRIVAPQARIKLGDPEFDGVDIEGAADGWMRDVSIVDATNGVSVGKQTRRMTIENVRVVNHTTVTGSALPFQFSAGGTQLLFDRCKGTGDRTWYFATMGREQGPNVLLDSRFSGNGHIQPHQRWSTGLLIDRCDVPDGGIDLMNRGEMGSGHGWTIGWSVVWNCKAATFVLQQPPGSMNWGIGNVGRLLSKPMPTFRAGPKLPSLPIATIDSQGSPMNPRSLYRAQLEERLGE